MLIVHTGDGKGKTTAALGMALRAWAQGWSIGVYQFVKSAQWRTGEEQAFAQLGGVTWEKLGTGWTWSRAHNEDVAAARAAEGWAHIRAGLVERRHQLWVLDEFTYPLQHGWVELDDVLTTLATHQGDQHVVITGRRAPQALIDAADLVTEMTKIKHPFDQGKRGQAGLEW